MGRTTMSRAAAVRRAQQAKQARDAKRLARERKIEQALADFYEQTGLVEQLRSLAAARAARIVADAEQAAAEPRRLAAAAVARLEALGENRSAIAELTGLSPADIRELLAHTSAAATATSGSAPASASGSAAGSAGVNVGGGPAEPGDAGGRQATRPSRN